ncbi:hypothetical protein ACFX1R_042745 [Malus domestica]
MVEMETLGKIKHRNLVPLLGYCKIGEERLLVYEFMEYGSLEEMLHGRTKTRDRRMLTWEERKKIARGRRRGASLSFGEPWELTRWSLLAVLGGCAHLLLLPISFSSMYSPSSSISCLAATNDFNDRRQTTSRS